jgi:hypothetical protein
VTGTPELNNFGRCDGDAERMNDDFFEVSRGHENDFRATLNLTKKKLRKSMEKS